MLCANNALKHESLGDIGLSRLQLFQQKQEMFLAERRYTVETLWKTQDLRELISLRQHSFFEEFDPDLISKIELFDQYDLNADHVVVRSRETGEIVASYRILNSDHTNKFYSAEQFEINKLAELPGTKLELSRAVVHKDHRNGIVLTLMWKGLAEYAARTNADYFFGCSSIKSISPVIAYSLFWNLYPYFYSDKFSVRVLEDYKFDQNFSEEEILSPELAKQHIPSLLKSYLKVGSQIVSEPALDRTFKCFDFLTVLDIKNMNESYRKKFFPR